jgi:hypothetical protein
MKVSRLGDSPIPPVLDLGALFFATKGRRRRQRDEEARATRFWPLAEPNRKRTQMENGMTIANNEISDAELDNVSGGGGEVKCEAKLNDKGEKEIVCSVKITW